MLDIAVVREKAQFVSNVALLQQLLKKLAEQMLQGAPPSTESIHNESPTVRLRKDRAGPDRLSNASQQRRGSTRTLKVDEGGHRSTSSLLSPNLLRPGLPGIARLPAGDAAPHSSRAGGLQQPAVLDSSRATPVPGERTISGRGSVASSVFKSQVTEHGDFTKPFDFEPYQADVAEQEERCQLAVENEELRREAESLRAEKAETELAKMDKLKEILFLQQCLKQYEGVIEELRGSLSRATSELRTAVDEKIRLAKQLNEAEHRLLELEARLRYGTEGSASAASTTGALAQE